jgi:hypothetical protein
MQILQQIMSGNMNLPNFHDAPVAAPEPITLRAIFQYMMFSFTFVQSMVQPIQNAIHLYKTDSICLKLGKQILEIRKALQEFRADLGQVNGIHVKLSFLGWASQFTIAAFIRTSLGLKRSQWSFSTNSPLFYGRLAHPNQVLHFWKSIGCAVISKASILIPNEPENNL